jgi:hypothetical protein
LLTLTHTLIATVTINTNTQIKKGKYHFHEDYWGRISPDAIDLIKKMMTVDQKER